MKKLSFLGLLLVSGLSYTANAKDFNDNKALAGQTEEKQLIKNIEFFDVEEDVETDSELLGYLPNDFDPYKGMIFDFSEIDFQEIPEPIIFNFNTADYLPKDFNPYKGQ